MDKKTLVAHYARCRGGVLRAVHGRLWARDPRSLSLEKARPHLYGCRRARGARLRGALGLRAPARADANRAPTRSVAVEPKPRHPYGRERRSRYEGDPLGKCGRRAPCRPTARRHDDSSCDLTIVAPTASNVPSFWLMKTASLTRRTRSSKMTAITTPGVHESRTFAPQDFSRQLHRTVAGTPGHRLA